MIVNVVKSIKDLFLEEKSWLTHSKEPSFGIKTKV